MAQADTVAAPGGTWILPGAFALYSVRVYRVPRAGHERSPIMQRGQIVLLECELTPSGFSGERVIRLLQADGTEYVGIAPVDYCLHREDQSPLAPDEPPAGKTMPGLVEGRVIENGGASAKVAMPDGEVIVVNFSQIPYLARTSQEQSYVPLRP